MDKKDIKSLTIKVGDRKYLYKFRGDSVGEWMRRLYSVYGKLVVNETWGEKHIEKIQMFLDNFYQNNKDMKKNTFKLVLKIKHGALIQGDYNKEPFEIKDGEVVEIISPSFANLNNPIAQKRMFVATLDNVYDLLRDCYERIPSGVHEIVKKYSDKYIALLKQLHHLEQPELGK